MTRIMANNVNAENLVFWYIQANLYYNTYNITNESKIINLGADAGLQWIFKLVLVHS